MTTEVTFDDEAPPPSKLRQKLHAKRDRAAAETVEALVSAPEDDHEHAEESDVEAKPEPKAKSGEPQAFKDLRAEEAKSTVEWIRSLQVDGSAVKVQIKRREPKWVMDPITQQRVKVDGLLDTIDREITEQEIQQTYGGGTYTLIIQQRNQIGRFEYKAARQLEIAGDPVLSNIPRLQQPKDEPKTIVQAAPQTDPLAVKAFEFMTKQAQDNQRHTGPSRHEQLEEIKMFMAPLERTIAELRAQNDRLAQQQTEAQRGNPAEATFQQKMMDKLIDGDSVRITALRAQHESEVRQIKDNAREDEKRLRDSFEREKQYWQNQHERELASLRSSHEVMRSAGDQAHNLALKVLESENKRLDRDNSKLEVELAALRGKKEPSLKDKVEEINMFKDLFEGDKEDDSNKSTFVKVLEGAAQSPIVGAAMERIMGGGQAQPVAPPQIHAQPPSRRVRMLRDKRNGQTYAAVATPEGERVVPVQRVQQPPVPGQPQIEGEVPPAVAQIPIPYIEPETVKAATDYMLNAFTNGTEPEMFAQSIRPMVKKEIIGAIGTMGVVEFFVKVGQLDASSPLMSQAGRNWSRKVAAVLTGTDG